MKTVFFRRYRRLSFFKALCFMVVVFTTYIRGAYGITTKLQSIRNHQQIDNSDTSISSTYQDAHIQQIGLNPELFSQDKISPSLSPDQQKHILEDVRQSVIDNSKEFETDTSHTSNGQPKQRSLTYLQTSGGNVHHHNSHRYHGQEIIQNHNNYHHINKNNDVNILSPPPPPSNPPFQPSQTLTDLDRRRITNEGVNNQKYQLQQYSQQHILGSPYRSQQVLPPSDFNSHAGHYIHAQADEKDNLFYRPDKSSETIKNGAFQESTISSPPKYFDLNNKYVVSTSTPSTILPSFKPSVAIDTEPLREQNDDTSEIEQQIRKQLQYNEPSIISPNSKSSSAINNLLKNQNQNTKFTILNAPEDFNPANLSSLPGFPADFLGGSSSGQNELVQLPPGVDISSIPELSNGIKGISSTIDNKRILSNTAIKTIVIRQKPNTKSESLTTTTTTTTTAKPPSVVLDELTKNVLPPGADYQVIRHDPEMGLLEQVQLDKLTYGSTSADSNSSPSNKKVTFVILEERPDGTVRVQGVRDNSGGSNNDILNVGNISGDNSASASSSASSELNTIIDKLNRGELKLPPSSISNSKKTMANKSSVLLKPASTTTSKGTPTSTTVPVPTPLLVDKFNDQDNFAQLRPVYKGPSKVGPNRLSTIKNKKPSDYNSNEYSEEFDPIKSSTTNPFKQYQNNDIFLPTAITTVKTINPISTLYPTSTASTPITWSKPILSKTKENIFPSVDLFKQSSNTPSEPSFVLDDNVNIFKQNEEIEDSFQHDLHDTDLPLSSSHHPSTLSNVLKNKGFYAMAKFLKKSGLDSILNDTMGPFTIFVPTDKAFRSLLVQLGGPDKADEKFRENPRLLIGLLLHHVIPGAFNVKSLQDEMTGVSLAGTQLRVNTFTTQDVEWNDIKVITINGARILDDKKDIVVNYPSDSSSYGVHSIAHAIDRVLFPLPVGDLLQTLQSDRDQKYTEFLKLIRFSGMTSVLLGSKTHTLFAPVNRAFMGNSNASRLLEHIESASAGSNDPVELLNIEEAKALVMRHLVPNAALYTAGMKFYQVKDSLLLKSIPSSSAQLTIYKDSGKVRVNSANIIARNIPATNGVVHAIDSLL
ncbi:probable serine/threonine-protein kinase DDB_G0275165 [Daktulosphaira vitifoliae]|uniref:probable serine/threonine-protein kinase DDB_G0275165 n=1 Tax=Daktulosphaira vitifoliae TaxID=58002 RepID=UPI0021A9F113|nr:probable serine/threonine-protein kinase DDB_G0275165 [Daktulosphaira vitifoliae]